MDDSKRDFVKKACLGTMCLCGLSNIANAKIFENMDVKAAPPKQMQVNWILEVLKNVDQNLSEEERRKIIKSASIAEYENQNVETNMAQYKGDIKKFISFLEKDWGWICNFENDGDVSDEIIQNVKDGNIGSILNCDPEKVNELQRVAIEENRLGIPLLYARDVIHGFKTVFPIPLGQACSWDTTIITEGARVAAAEAASTGIRYTFAPMIDVTRDPRWGRIAESLGEDPYLTSVLGVAMIKGFQGSDMSAPDRVAACAKHFAAY